MPSVSIIVTSYNIENYIEESLRSIVEQTLEDIEIIVVDDGSSDSSPDIIRRIATTDSRIVPVMLENNSIGGVATAANAGLDRATGAYVGFADGDDIYEPEMFERLLEACESAGADLAMCGYHVLDDSTGELHEPADSGRWNELREPAYRLDNDDDRRRFLRFIAVPWRKLYRRSVLERNDIRFPVVDYFYEDNPFHWFAVLSASSIAVVPESLCQHRVARAGQTMATADERLLKIFEHHQTIRSWLDERDLGERFGPTLLAWAISQMEWIAPKTPDDLRRQLFATLRTIYSTHDPATVRLALVEGKKGQRAQLLSDAIMTDNFARFEQLLSGVQPRRSNPVASAAHHLRHSGLAETAQMTKRYLGSKARATGIVQNRRRTPDRITNDDIMFGLTVLEQRLSRIERTLADQSDHRQRP